MSPLQFLAHTLVPRKVWNHDDLVIGLAKMIDPSVSTLADATKIIWIKEVSIFVDLPLPPHRVP